MGEVIEFDRYDFVAGTVTKVKREIDSSKLLAGNALFSRLKADTAPSGYVLISGRVIGDPDDGDCA